MFTGYHHLLYGSEQIKTTVPGLHRDQAIEENAYPVQYVHCFNVSQNVVQLRKSRTK